MFWLVAACVFVSFSVQVLRIGPTVLRLPEDRRSSLGSSFWLRPPAHHSFRAATSTLVGGVYNSGGDYKITVVAELWAAVLLGLFAPPLLRPNIVRDYSLLKSIGIWQRGENNRATRPSALSLFEGSSLLFFGESFVLVYGWRPFFGQGFGTRSCLC